jgi:hypothetical protein
MGQQRELDGNMHLMEYFGVLFRKCRVNLCKDVVNFDFYNFIDYF